MTPHEKIIWGVLHEGELAALNWRSQCVFGDYIVDFVSHPARIVVEVDGAQHSEGEQAKHDAERTAWLETQGYRVLRFWNPETVQERNGVWLTIHAAAMETPAKARMQRWREKHMAVVREVNSRIAEHGARLPLDGGGVARAARDGGGARAGREDEASRGKAGNAGGPHPLSHPPTPAAPADDSSPIEGERGALPGEGD